MKQRPAFTLIEMLVVAAVFSIAFLIASTVFTNISTRQRSILVRQRISADARYVLENVARTVRIGSIDYVYYADQRCSTGHSGSPGDGPCDLSQAQKVLAIRDQSN
ncbi:MAG: type II secretion system protein, partial [Candidatus Kerfeldbacteria bacterium]|nr:type II secretion system protein [Candidatus Kerfeldbacteria bacterium]